MNRNLSHALFVAMKQNYLLENLMEKRHLLLCEKNAEVKESFSLSVLNMQVQ